MSLSKNIRFFRRKNRLTQEKLSELASCSVDTLQRWENGTREPKASDIMKLCEILHCTESELLNSPADASWELRLVMRRAGDPQEGVMEMTTNGSNAALYMEDSKMAIMLSADYALWEDDVQFEELIEQLRRKRTLGLKSRKEGW